MSMIGTSVVRKEDPELLTVGGKYVDDLAPADALHATFVRSIMAHANIAGVDASEALAMDGVEAVFTADDLNLEGEAPNPMLNQSMVRFSLAKGRTRFVGEPIAVVITTTREIGVDAAELVAVDYDPLPPVMNFEDALAGETLLFPEAETNVAFAVPGGEEDIFEGVEATVSLKFRNHRLAPCPLEPRATVSTWSTGEDGRPFLTQYATTQGAHGTRDALSGAMGVDAEQVRVITPDVGGGFGAKNGGYPEDLVVAEVARKLGQPIRWAETRSESMLGLVHGRAVEFDVTVGGDRSGRVKALKVKMLQDGGAYPAVGSILPFITRIMASGVYDIEKVDFGATSLMTNTVPVGAYRGAGRPEAAHIMERMMDVWAAELGLDPAEVRRMNYHQPSTFPLTTPTGAAMDSGEYEKALDAALAAADYEGLRAEQTKRRDSGDTRLLGIGISSYVEIANPMANPEFGSCEIRPDGSALLLTGSSSHGQGHHTAFAQLAADLTGIPFDKIEVQHGDTAVVKRGGGTGGSKSLQVGGSAVYIATEDVVAKAKELAAELLEANPADIVLDTASGDFSVAGTPAIAKTWAEIGTAAAADDGSNLIGEADFEPGGATFPFGSHVSVVEVDVDTGEVTLLSHVACDDAGNMVNPLIVEGQVHGGVVSGMAQALMEEFIYDADGNPLTSNFMDYALVSAAEMPNLVRIPQETPTDRNPLGAKGIGESGTIGATPAVQNAVIDALSHLGVRHVDIPVTAERVWRSINA